MRNLLYILFVIPVLAFSQVYITTGGPGYFNVKLNNGSTISYPKDQYEIAQDSRGWVWLRNINNARNITADREQSVGVYFDKWRINGQTPASASALIDSLTAYIYKDAEAISNIISAQTDNGNTVDLSATPEGHLEVAIHTPLNPFGSIHTEGLIPITQGDAVYGIDSTRNLVTIGRAISGTSSASVTGTNNLFTCSTGTTAYSFSVMQSRKRVRYRAGQGVVGRFAGFYSNPAANSYILAGIGTSESGFYFGYRNDTFGILYTRGGVREVQTLTVSVGSTGADSVTVTLAGVATKVAVTGSSSAIKTAYDISKGVYAGWDAEQIGATVRFVASDAINKTGTFSISGVTATGSFAETLQGRATTDSFIPQSQWNADKLDGTGGSGYTINPQNGNVYEIGFQYLGFGAITFAIETYSDDGNNATFTTVHTIKYPNTATQTSLSQPSLPFTMSAYSAGSTTNVSVSVSSYGCFIEGEKVLTGARLSYIRETSNYVGSTANIYYPMFTIRNDRVYAVRANQSVINLISASLAHDDATPVSLYLIRNATLAGTPNFSQYSTLSPVSWDVAATTATITRPEQIIFCLQAGQNSAGFVQFADDITLQPGESITVACRAVTGTATYVNVSLNTREDQ